MTPERWHAVDLGSEHRKEVAALFAEVFGDSMSEALWLWKYGGQRGVATGTRDEAGHLLAHYGGTARTLCQGTHTFDGVQLGDVMVARHARGILSRRGPFATAATAFLERHVGVSKGFALGFGFPNSRHARLGEALGLYRVVGEVKELRWECPAALAQPTRRWGWAPIDWSARRTDARLNALWRALSDTAQGFVLPQRDARWWRHRYANHPGAAYRCWWVRSRLTRRVIGALALRPGTVPGADWEIVDFLGRADVLPTLLSSARAIAGQAQAGHLHGWFSDALAVRLLVGRGSAGVSEQTACTLCVTQRRSPSLAADALGRPWWLTGGDTDFR